MGSSPLLPLELKLLMLAASVSIFKLLKSVDIESVMVIGSNKRPSVALKRCGRVIQVTAGRTHLELKENQNC